MKLLTNPVRRYAWGSIEAIPKLLGVAPDGRPQAELWMGAHERASSRVDDASLADLVAADPERLLGSRWAASRRLPFLAKVVAVAAPLSLQVHPGSGLAREGYLAEERAGVDRDSARRSFPDDVVKVEMVYAVSTFHTLCGFRPVPDMLAWLDCLDLAALRPTIDALCAEGRSALPGECERLLRVVDPADVVPMLVERCTDLLAGSAWSASARAALEVAHRHPQDPAVALALLLQPLLLEPGDALVVAPGQPHTYLSGTAVEVQANSDNVLRAGLTDKHLDVTAVLRALDTGVRGIATVAAHRVGAEQVFATADTPFELSVVDPGETTLGPPNGPQLLCCLDGAFELTDNEAPLRLGRGQAAFGGADVGAVKTSGRGTLVRVVPRQAG